MHYLLSIIYILLVKEPQIPKPPVMEIVLNKPRATTPPI